MYVPSTPNKAFVWDETDVSLRAKNIRNEKLRSMCKRTNYYYILKYMYKKTNLLIKTQKSTDPVDINRGFTGFPPNQKWTTEFPR